MAANLAVCIAEALSRWTRVNVGVGPGWSLAEDAELVASALWPPLPIAAHIKGRTDAQAARRRWQLAEALKLRQITVALEPGGLEALASAIRTQHRQLLFTQRAAAVGVDAPVVLTKRVLDKQEAVGRCPAVSAALPKLLGGYGGQGGAPPTTMLQVRDVIAVALPPCPLAAAAATRAVWLMDAADGTSGMHVRESGAQRARPAAAGINCPINPGSWLASLEPVEACTTPVLLTGGNGTALHGVSLPSGLGVLPSDHPVQEWLEMLHSPGAAAPQASAAGGGAAEGGGSAWSRRHNDDARRRSSTSCRPCRPIFLDRHTAWGGCGCASSFAVRRRRTWPRCIRAEAKRSTSSTMQV